MGQGKQEVHFSDNCLREGINVNRVLHYLIGDDTGSNAPVVTSDSESETSSSESSSSDEDQLSSSLSQATASSCTSKFFSME